MRTDKAPDRAKRRGMNENADTSSRLPLTAAMAAWALLAAVLAA
jgi:hypothetical protein